MEIKKAIASRFSARAFVSDPIEMQVIDDILTLASRAPSGSNMQPWKVSVVSGEVRDRLSDAAILAMESNTEETQEYLIYPKNLPDPYRARRFDTGMSLYNILSIERDDKVARNKQLLENFRFFGAPVGLVFSIEKMFVPGQLGDLGMFIQNVMLLARDYNLHTCPQAAWQLVNETVHRELDIPVDQMIYCGLAMGYLDTEHPANQLRLKRIATDKFVRYLGFSDKECNS